MTAETFNKLLNLRLAKIVESLGQKANEYATDDRLHNFKEAGKTFECLPTEACWAYMMKHLVSIKDLANGTKKGSPDLIHEKIGDAINYLVLMEALLLEANADETIDKAMGVSNAGSK